MSEDDRIVINMEDLAEPAAPPPPPPGAPQQRAPLPPMPVQSPRIGVGSGGAVAAPSSSSTGLAKLGANPLISGLLTGLIGGVLGMVVAENLQNPNRPRDFDLSATAAEIEQQLRIDSGLWVAVFAAVLGAAIMAWDGITSASGAKAGRDGAIGAAIGAVAGFVGGYVAQWVYSSLLPDDPFSESAESTFLLARTVGWAVFGGLLGAGMGIRGGSKRVIHGLLGGLIGGTVGGFVFHQIEYASTDASSAVTNRLLGLTATGIGVALGVGIVERLLRDAWLQVVGGPMTGKEFILYKDSTSVGSSPKCDIVLVKDGAVAPHHLSFVRDARGAVGVQPAPGASVLVNGTPTGGQALRSGDAVSLGASTFLVRDRTAG